MNREVRNETGSQKTGTGTEHAFDGCLEWGDTLEVDTRYRILPEGDYRFRITGFERGHYDGGQKIPPYPQAKLAAAVDYDGHIVEVRFNLLLYRDLEWRLSAFFRSIGLKKEGERVTMDWTKVPNARGMFHLKPESYTDADGKLHETNQVSRFLDFDPALWTESVPAATDVAEGRTHHLKQIRFLERKGFRNMGTWKFQEAEKMIDTLKRSG